MKEKQTRKKNDTTTKNARILVNWESKRVIVLNKHEYSPEVTKLYKQGYDVVGTIRPDGRAFIKPEYFSPEDKYIDHEKNH